MFPDKALGNRIRGRASVVALFYPQAESSIESAALRIAALAVLLLAALGYGKIEADVDAANSKS